ncbi:MAG TPA: hypothetical protein GX712_06475 [Bacteroidales bacterium]|nr:hypothetical protein [Bacteroidales bacterium]
MPKSYTIEKNPEIIDWVIEENDNLAELKEYNIRFAIIYVTNTTSDGEVVPAFKSLPYKVKLNSAKDRCIKNIDVEIYIDESYFESADSEEKEAVIYGALNQIVIKHKDGMPIFQDDGVVKLVLKRPDMIFEGFSKCAEKYKIKSPEHKAFTQLTTDFNNILF